jgi:6-phosphofructokinase 1
VLTSGGDAPGMNAAIRAVVRTGIYLGVEVHGVVKGYSGLIHTDFRKMDLSSVANIIQRGGTILKTDRCPDFHKKKYRALAAENLRAKGIDALVAIGGDGTFRGAHALWQETKFPVIGVPGTIDNDVYGTDVTIGFDTAINTCLDAIDKIRDTASSHDRLFIVEVMGRDSGYIAMDVGIGGGADAMVIPEAPTTTAELAARISRGIQRGKTSSIIIVAEGRKAGNSYAIAKELQNRFGFRARVCILGHIQRGGSPTARDRKVASVMGALAVRSLLEGKSDVMTGVIGREASLTPLKESFSRKKKFQTDLIELAEALAI